MSIIFVIFFYIFSSINTNILDFDKKPTFLFIKKVHYKSIENYKYLILLIRFSLMILNIDGRKQKNIGTALWKDENLKCLKNSWSVYTNKINLFSQYSIFFYWKFCLGFDSFTNITLTHLVAPSHNSSNFKFVSFFYDEVFTTRFFYIFSMVHSNFAICIEKS